MPQAARRVFAHSAGASRRIVLFYSAFDAGGLAKKIGSGEPILLRRAVLVLRLFEFDYDERVGRELFGKPAAEFNALLAYFRVFVVGLRAGEHGFFGVARRFYRIQIDGHFAFHGKQVHEFQNGICLLYTSDAADE